MPSATKDAVLGSAVDLARAVAVDLAEDPSDVGEYLGLVVEGERLVSHRFASAARGYRGWEWTVTVARVPRGRTATVCEAELLPGPDAVLGQAWLPWSERIRPGDIGPGDVLPFKADDPRLEPGWTPTGDPELDDVAIDELALARIRVLSPQGRDEAAERWYRGPHGPTSAGSLASAAACGSCGFLVPLQGSLGTVFGVCANQWSPDDGTVVSVDHGCGAHSETDSEAPPTDWPAADPLIDELSLELVNLTESSAAQATKAEVAAPDEAPTAPTDDAAAADDATEPVDTVTEATTAPDEPEVAPDDAEVAPDADVAVEPDAAPEPEPEPEPEPDAADQPSARPDPEP
ncbi:DUF3027 domain-containing protein [Cellulomonas humilata]|uniref:DUF3027 domain-containing protein n=1 Tax=Cellulomonas humilata TaxID=144055 RepID=A0A7Y6A3A1_9CELL|nr:DUF3027 domain-containing protein [Cellulomonas humilata]NUU18946.1 DUF3027 domain-containing protein [Cellulomonas humilata]